jgi:hypothetical protein
VTSLVTATGYPSRMGHHTLEMPPNTALRADLRDIRDAGDSDWIGFHGGELEGRRPKALCATCRAQLHATAAGGPGAIEPPVTLPSAAVREGASCAPLCFQCYRAEVARERALKGAGQIDTASVERFQTALPFEPVNRPRLEMLKADRVAARTIGHGFEDRRRRAQLAARHALRQAVAGFAYGKATPENRARDIAYAIHAAELQLPESWLPFVVSR